MVQRGEGGWFAVTVEGDDRSLTFSPNVNKCGTIRDGVAFKHQGEGAWVISMEDLREMTRLAAEVRNV